MERHERKLIDQPESLPDRGCHNCKFGIVAAGLGGAVALQCRQDSPRVVACHELRQNPNAIAPINAPPVLACIVLTVFPTMQPVDWCGKWDRKDLTN